MPEEKRKNYFPEPARMLELQWCEEFINYCRNRILMGTFRYGYMKRGNGTYDNIQSAIDRLKMYQDTGNKEHLVDVANLCQVEYIEEVHPNAHWESIDDGKHKEKLNANK
jgi:hypothetical protein